MTTNNPTDIFEEDELQLRKVHQDWTAEQLLQEPGVFFLKDIAHLLELDSNRLLQHAS